MANFKDLRVNYPTQNLQKSDLCEDPFSEFDVWYQFVKERSENMIYEVNAMALSTISASHKPRSRMVLLKSYTSEGFVFFTDYTSKKSDDLSCNKAASLLFWWPSVHRQVRIEGIVEKVSEKVSDDYFAIRPRESQLAASASNQSHVLNCRQDLEQEYQRCKLNHEGVEVKRPQRWGGYVLRPELFEFWQGSGHRLHDRFEYQLSQSGWHCQRLSP
jgi:pyridoxamine 5'-phosphate oxidase